MVGFLCMLLLVYPVHYYNVDANEDIKSLIDLEAQLIHNLVSYSRDLQSKLDIIESAIQEYSALINGTDNYPDLYLSNQLFAYKLKRHMHQDWVKWQTFLEHNVGSAYIDIHQTLVALIPQSIDYQKDISRLHYLFKFYNFAPQRFLQQTSSPYSLSTSEFYHIGVELYNQQEYHHAGKWLTAAINNHTNVPHLQVSGVPYWHFYKMQYKVFFKLGMRDQAEAMLSRALQLSPRNKELLEQLEKLQSLTVAEQKRLPAPAPTNGSLQQLCRGFLDEEPELMCGLTVGLKNFLELAPLRVEEVSDEPYLSIYKNILSTREIRHLKGAFQHCPERSKFEESLGIKGCAMSDNYSALTQNLMKRVEEMTGIDNRMKVSYILEYGQLDPFYIFGLAKFENFKFNDIEATVIFFLNNIPLGGGYALPNHDVIAFPRRGDALFTAHEGVFQHTVCPNMIGRGMVMIKFLFYEV